MRYSFYQILVAIFLLSGCQSISVPPSYEYKEIATKDFTIASWQKITEPNGTYKIYIEGGRLCL